MNPLSFRSQDSLRRLGMSSLFSSRVSRSFACSISTLAFCLLSCAIAVCVVGIHWKIFTSNQLLFGVVNDAKENKEVLHRNVALTWTSFLVWPSCIAGFTLIWVRKKSMILLLVITSVLAFGSSLYSTSTSDAKYQEIHKLLYHDDDDIDDLCEDIAYNNENYCECKQTFKANSTNHTKIWTFQVECDDLETIRRRYFLFFIFTLATSVFSAALLSLGICAYCCSSEKVRLIQNESQRYNSIKTEEHGTTPSQRPQQTREASQQIYNEATQRNVGFSNPAFIHCDDGGQKKIVFCYPYPGEIDVGTNKVLTNKQRDATVTYSKFKTENVNLF